MFNYSHNRNNEPHKDNSALDFPKLKYFSFQNLSRVDKELGLLNVTLIHICSRYNLIGRKEMLTLGDIRM